MKVVARILIILLAAGIVSGIAYALVQSGLVAAAGPGLGRERELAGFMAEGRLPGRGELGQPPAALRGRFPEGGALDRQGRGFADGDFRREGRDGVNLSARTWATWGKNLGIIAAIVVVVALANRLAGRRRTRPRRPALDASSGAAVHAAPARGSGPGPSENSGQAQPAGQADAAPHSVSEPASATLKSG